MKSAKFLFILSLFTVVSSGFLFALNPSREYKQLPDKFNMIYEETKVTTSDGALLTVWYFPANVKTTKLVLISHNGEGNMADYLRKVDQFTSIGLNVVTFDYRGFGTSSDFKIDNNMYIYPHFQDDEAAMIDYCRKNHVAKFFMYGWGIGAGLSLGIGYNRPEVIKIIADSPFLSMEDLEARFSKSDAPMEVPFAGFDKKHEPINTFSNPPTPTLTGVLLLIGADDKFFTAKDMDLIAKKQKKFTEVKVLPGGDGKDNFTPDKAAYFKIIKEFLG